MRSFRSKRVLRSVDYWRTVVQLLKPDPVKFCANCGVQLSRKRSNARLEDYGSFLRRRHCSRKCGNSKPVVGKSAHHWRARTLRGDHCEECGTSDRLHVHHVDNDHTNDASENLRTLCGSCHLRLHWREDRDKRIASAWRAVRLSKTCVVCGVDFTVSVKSRKQQTCGQNSCWRTLLSRRALERYGNAS